MKKIIALTALSICCLLLCSEVAIAQQDCDCIANLDSTIKKTEMNYVGYPDMIKRKMESQYKTLVKKLRANAAKESDPQKCFTILKDYVVFFNDKHFDIEYSVTDSTRFKYVSLTEDAFKKDFATKKRDSIEGIWISPDSSMKLAINKTAQSTYQAVILQTKDAKLKPGLVYYTFTKTKNGFIFDRYDWMTPEYPVRQRSGLLFVWNFEIWGKVYPNAMTDGERSQLNTWRDYAYGLDCRKADSNTVLLTIGSFNRDNKIKEIIAKNDSLIRATKNLVIDMRGNGGGNSGWTYLLPYFYTQPIDQGYSYVRVTPENIAAVLPGLKASYEKTSIDPRWKKSYTPELIASYKKASEEMPRSKETFYPLRSLTLHYDSVLKTPEKIALVVDDLGGSSTEYFFFISKQSSKVKRYGEPTFGMMDYMGGSHDTKLPFKDYYFSIPDTKATWTDSNPTNKTGFIPENNLRHLPWSTWVDYVIKDLGK